MMGSPVALRPVAPIDVAGLFPEVGRELIALLRSLAPEDWRRPTVCPAWTVKDVAAHLLDTALRRLSFDRDRFTPPSPGRPIASPRDLVAFLNDLNAEWVAAFRRVSPAALTDLLATIEPPLAAHLASVDPWAPALFPVAWAGESESLAWFDVARELTERWHHQQQIRLAAGAPPLDAPHLVEPVLETFLRALPPRYAEVPAPEGTAVAIRIEGRALYDFVLLRGETGWGLHRGHVSDPSAEIRMDGETAWLLLTKGLGGDEARAKAQIRGEESLVAPVFSTLAVMA